MKLCPITPRRYRDVEGAGRFLQDHDWRRRTPAPRSSSAEPRPFHAAEPRWIRTRSLTMLDSWSWVPIADWIMTPVPPGGSEVGLNSNGRSLFGPGSGNFNSLLPDQDSLFRSLGNSLKKRSHLADFELIQAPGSASKTRNSLYFSLIAGQFAWRGVRSRLRHPASSLSLHVRYVGEVQKARFAALLGHESEPEIVLDGRCSR